jgi:hypothetical protein
MNLSIPSMVVIGIVVAAVLMLVGDYLGYKIGRMKLFTYCGFTVLGVVIIFAIYAIIYALST